MIRLAALVLFAVGLAVGWGALVWSSTKLGAAPATFAAALLGVASTLVGQAMARWRRR